jgi:2-aminoadipate transaminase
MLTFARRMGNVKRSFIREILKVTEDPSIISFAGGLPNPAFFPSAEIADAASRVLSAEGPAALQYATTEGFPPLRQWIADRYARRGLRVKPDEVLVLNGSQQGLDLAAKIFLDPNDAVLVERPTYLAALQAFGLFEPTFVSVTLRDDGPDAAEVAQALARQTVRFCYAIPTFQNPSGISWSLNVRREVAGLLAGPRAIEDDPMASCASWASTYRSWRRSWGTGRSPTAAPSCWAPSRRSWRRVSGWGGSAQGAISWSGWSWRSRRPTCTRTDSRSGLFTGGSSITTWKPTSPASARLTAGSAT